MSASLADTPLSTAELAAQTAPRITTELPGPVARTVIERDERFTSPSLTARLPARRRARRRRHHRGRGRQPLPRLHRRHRRHRDRPLPPARRRRHPRPGRRSCSTLSDRLLLPAADRPRRTAGRDWRRCPDAAHVFLTNSGTEAVEAALKLARCHTGRPTGSPSSAPSTAAPRGLSLSGSKARTAAASASWCPAATTPRSPSTPTLTGAAYIEERRCSSASTAARRGGGHLRRADPGRGRLPRAAAPASCRPARLCDKHGILLVVDEVQRGMGRTGKMWAVEHWGVAARHHLLAGKGHRQRDAARRRSIARADVMDWPSGSHGSTFGGNPVACAAALATLDLVERGLTANATAVGDHLLAGAAALSRATTR